MLIQCVVLMLLVAQAAQALARVHNFKAEFSAQHYIRKHARHQLQTYSAVSSSCVTGSLAGCIRCSRNIQEEVRLQQTFEPLYSPTVAVQDY